MGSEKKTHTKAKYMESQNPNKKTSQKKEKQTTYKELRIRITSDFKKMTLKLEDQNSGEKGIFSSGFYIKTIKYEGV